MNNITKDEIITTDKYLNLVSNNIYYIKTDLLYNNLNSMIWRNNIHTLKSSKVWITGHSDYPINNTLFNKYQNNCDYWFTVNNEVDNKKIKSLPLGITNFTNETELHPIFGNNDIMLEVMALPKEYTNLVYLNFNINTHTHERQQCYNVFHNKKYVTVGKIENTLEGRKKYLKEIRNHKFVLCPRGGGIDTHRLWETLYMDSIPIVKKCFAMNDFYDLPILFIDDWSEIENADFLERKYEEITSKTWNMEKLKFSYWKNLIINTANT